MDESGRNSQKGPAALLWVVKSMKQNAHIQHAGRSRRRNGLVATGLVFALMLAILMCYSNYIQAQIKSECTKNLLETYEQVDKTFLMFAQRNWNVLSDWNGRLQHLAKSDLAVQRFLSFQRGLRLRYGEWAQGKCGECPQGI